MAYQSEVVVLEKLKLNFCSGCCIDYHGFVLRVVWVYNCDNQISAQLGALGSDREKRRCAEFKLHDNIVMLSEDVFKVGHHLVHKI